MQHPFGLRCTATSPFIPGLQASDFLVQLRHLCTRVFVDDPETQIFLQPTCPCSSGTASLSCRLCNFCDLFCIFQCSAERSFRRCSTSFSFCCHISLSTSSTSCGISGHSSIFAQLSDQLFLSLNQLLLAIDFFIHFHLFIFLRTCHPQLPYRPAPTVSSSHVQTTYLCHAFHANLSV